MAQIYSFNGMMEYHEWSSTITRIYKSILIYFSSCRKRDVEMHRVYKLGK